MEVVVYVVSPDDTVLMGEEFNTTRGVGVVVVVLSVVFVGIG